MEVRRIRTDDVEAYREVRLRSLRLAPDAFGSTFEEASKRTDAEWREFTERLATSAHTAGFVLDRGDTSSSTFGGLATIRLLDDPADHASRDAPRDAPRDAEVNQMWLDEDLRGGDWAPALLAGCEAFARTLGPPPVERVTLWVAATNERAARLYARCGYEPTGETDEAPEPHLGTEVRLAKRSR